MFELNEVSEYLEPPLVKNAQRGFGHLGRFDLIDCYQFLVLSFFPTETVRI